jgi:PadR family transcriptional regulator PadR
MPRQPVELLQGSLHLLLLKTLSWGPMHGFGIARWIRQLTRDQIQLEEGSLYPALYRMETRGWISSEWGVTENNRRAKNYRLTAAGRRQFTEEAGTWRQFASAVAMILDAPRAPA